MRKSSQVIMSALSLAAVAAGVQIGSATKPVSQFVPEPTLLPTVKVTTEPNPTTPISGSTPKPGVTPPVTPTVTPPKPTVTLVTQKRTSAAVAYKYGTVQLTVTKKGSTITDITMNQAGATNGRGTSFPYLISLALQAQSQTFDTSMLTGATFSVDAFMQALDNAVKQF